MLYRDSCNVTENVEKPSKTYEIYILEPGRDESLDGMSIRKRED